MTETVGSHVTFFSNLPEVQTLKVADFGIDVLGVSSAEGVWSEGDEGDTFSL